MDIQNLVVTNIDNVLPVQLELLEPVGLSVSSVQVVASSIVVDVQ